LGKKIHFILFFSPRIFIAALVFCNFFLKFNFFIFDDRFSQKLDRIDFADFMKTNINLGFQSMGMGPNGWLMGISLRLSCHGRREEEAPERVWR
jgi:hypothetical protein